MYYKYTNCYLFPTYSPEYGQVGMYTTTLNMHIWVADRKHISGQPGDDAFNLS